MTVTGVTVTGRVLAANGTVALPAISFASDPNSGFYWETTGEIAFSSDGVRAAMISGSSIIAGTATSAFSLASGTTDGAYIQGVGNVVASRDGATAASFRRRTSSGRVISVFSDTANVGGATVTGAGTTWDTTSDYRRKSKISAVKGFWERLMALNPISFMWDIGGWDRGFLAHEFAKPYPRSVNGEKDAVDADGKPIHQSMQASTSEVMADVAAALQDIQRRLTAAGL